MICLIRQRRHIVLLGAMFVALALTGWVVAEEADHDAVTARLQTLLPDMDGVSVNATPMNGLFEVRIGSELVYISEDGRYLLQGRLIDLDTQRDLTDASMSEMRQEQLAALDRTELISFGADNPVHEVLVFTDPDCGFCRRLHEQVAGYEAAGIRIHYLAFPRAGVGSATYDKLVSVWCAEDRHAAMDMAKAGRTPPPATCDNPVLAQYQLGQALGVTGTPALVTSSGAVIPGFVPPDQLRSRLDNLASSAP
jgi:thiol:disulfide interchange protein DsbC